MLLREAADNFGWKLNYGGIALMWRGGCIIRSAFLGKIRYILIRNTCNLSWWTYSLRKLFYFIQVIDEKIAAFLLQLAVVFNVFMKNSYFIRENVKDPSFFERHCKERKEKE